MHYTIANGLDHICLKVFLVWFASFKMGAPQSGRLQFLHYVGKRGRVKAFLKVWKL